MINSDYIRSYLLEKFKGKYRLVSSGREMTVPSVFTGKLDWKKHMSINLDTGLWQCFKSGNKGNFYKLYSILENKPYGRSRAEITFRSYVENWEPQKEDLLKKNESTFNTSVKDNDWYSLKDSCAKKARDYVAQRGLSTNKFLYSLAENTFDRLVIPYIVENEVIYYQARALEPDRLPKYYNPPEVKSSNVLYPFDESRDYVVVTEGPLDAIALQQCGVNATSTQGSYISKVQASMLKSFEGKVILGFDNDEAGSRGVRSFSKLKKKLLLPDFYSVVVPSELKDWNDFLLESPNPKHQIKEYIAKNAKLVDWRFGLIDL